MKIKGMKLAAGAVMAVFLLSSSADVFATNTYNINYAGGEILGSDNVQIRPELIESLVPLFNTDDVNISLSNSSKWQTGYLSSEGCHKFSYLKIDSNNTGNGVSATLSNDKYTIDVAFNGVELEGNTDDKGYTVGFVEKMGLVWGGYQVYSDAECTNKVDGVERALISEDVRIFVRMNIKLHKKGSSEIYKTNDMFFGITDIDAAQSYKILNSGNELTSGNMYAKSAEGLQKEGSSLKNRFVPSGNYIYSEFDDGKDFAMKGDNNVYVKLTSETQSDGLDIVFGFAEAAASGVEYYNKQYKVAYVSDDNGKITGIKKEDVLSGNNPTGSTQEPNEGYEFTHWTADVDVTLKDGKVIKAGEKITEAQIKQVVVTQDIEFKAYHSPELKPEEPAAPNTGASTEELNATQIVVSVLGIGLGALMIGLLPYLNRKKIGFNKRG
ncbi:hypothetical protein IJH26_01265 [Candidatus Saccharibacteria bacterium]|nr:hypothetical protein [Candidatus Saccharibacteria bacterium]